MYAILDEHISLRSFWYIPYCYYHTHSYLAGGLSEEAFNLLRKCDGHTYLERSELFDHLEKNHLVHECEYGEELTDWQQYKEHDNRYMPKMNLQITGRCNYNCKHCFNAKDNLPLQSELSLEQLEHLFDECVGCGVRAFTITGGEPTAHKHYKEIIEAIYKRHMFVFELNTNGFYINQEMLDWMKSINYYPEIKISFDGIGFHNWMRGYNRAEEVTLKAIELCVKNGFDVKVQMNVNKRNIDSILPSLIMLDEMGVNETRLIKTTNAPRWVQNAKGDSMSLEEYFDFELKLVEEYTEKPRNMILSGWLTIRLNPKEKYFNLEPVQCGKGEFNESILLCSGARGMIAVGSNGNVYPCMQSQGWYEEHNMIWGNILTDGLHNILGESKYMNLITLSVKDRFAVGSSCINCKYLKACAGGCPAIAQLTNGDILKEDGSKCIFFKKGYYEKFLSVIPKEYRNVKPMELD